MKVAVVTRASLCWPLRQSVFRSS